MYVNIDFSRVHTFPNHVFYAFRHSHFIRIYLVQAPEPTPQELLEGRGAQHHRLCGSFECHGQGRAFELPFYRLVEPTESANYNTSTYVALPVLRVARIPIAYPRTTCA